MDSPSYHGMWQVTIHHTHPCAPLAGVPPAVAPRACPWAPCPAGAAWEWMEDWLDVKEGQSGGQMPKQYRMGQFKQDATA